MVIRQRQTVADDFLLKVVFPYLDAHDADRLLGLARFWNVEVRPTREQGRPVRSVEQAPLIRQAWRKLAQVFSTASASA